MIVSRSLHQQQSLLNDKCHDFCANLVMVARIYFSHPCRERFLALHLHEIILWRIRIRDGNQLRTLGGERPENEVVRIPPPRCQKQPENDKNGPAHQEKVAAGAPDLPADEVIPREVTSYSPRGETWSNTAQPIGPFRIDAIEPQSFVSL